MALASRLAIIAGGLGGIGSAIGRVLRADGAKLALLYAPFEADRTKEALQANYGDDARDVQLYECEISSPTSVDEAFHAIAADVAKSAPTPPFPSICVNAAGYVALTPLEDTPPEEVLKHLNFNLLGPMLVSQAFARLYFRTRTQAMEKAGVVPPGRVVSIASQAAHVALDNHGAYCASKAGLIGLNKCMANEWGGRGITANTVSPGPVWTAMGKKAWSDKEAREAYQKQIPTGRFAEPEEVAAAVGYLCQDSSGMVNGVDIGLDGGFTIR